MKVRVSVVRFFDSNFKTIGYANISKPSEFFCKMYFGRGGYETVAIWKVKLKP